MKCPVCNHKHKQGITICPNCNNKLHVETGTNPHNRNVVGSYRVHLNKKTLIILGITAVMLIATLIYALVKPTNRTGIIITDNRISQSQNNTTSGQNQTNNTNNNQQNESSGETNNTSMQ